MRRALAIIQEIETSQEAAADPDREDQEKLEPTKTLIASDAFGFGLDGQSLRNGY